MVVFLAGVASGSIWGRRAWGIWWTWDARLTSSFVCLLLGAGYIYLRHVIDEPLQRARLSAVLSIFGGVDVIIVWKSIEWWRTQHPGPVLSLRRGGGMAAGMEPMIYWNWLAILLVAGLFVAARMRLGRVEREIYSLRRVVHARAA